MTIGEMINKLKTVGEKIGMNEQVPVVRVGFGENDYVLPDYIVQGEFEDQNGNNFKCALVGESGGEEFSKVGIPHYKWKPFKDKI